MCLGFGCFVWLLESTNAHLLDFLALLSFVLFILFVCFLFCLFFLVFIVSFEELVRICYQLFLCVILWDCVGKVELEHEKYNMDR